MPAKNICLIAVVLFCCVAVFRVAAAQDKREHIAIRAIYGGLPVELTEGGKTLSDYGVNAIFMGSRGLTTERVALIKQHEARVFAEFNTMHVAAYLKEHPDAAPVGPDGQLSPAPQGWQGVCPTHPAYRRFRMDEFRKVLTDFEIDGIWLDYHHSHASWERAEPDMPDTCFCERCVDQFARETSTNLADAAGPQRNAIILEKHHDAWVGWRCDVFTDWVREFRAIVDRTRPQALLGTFHCPWTDSERHGALRNKLAIDLEAQAEYIDVFSIMPYHARFGHHTDPEWISRQTAWLGSFLGIQGKPGERHKIWPIVQLSDWGEEVPVAQVKTVIDHGTRLPATGLIVFNWGSLRRQMEKVDRMSVSFRAVMGPVPQPSAAADWPQWRGPNRDGTVLGFSIPEVWPKTLEKQWSVQVGDGYSSPVVVDGRVYQLSRQGDEEHVQCLGLDSGKTLWHDAYPAAGEVHSAAASHGIGPKSTPAVAEGKLYTLGIGNILSCFDTQTGKLVWRKTFQGRFSKPAPSCGTSTSPLVDGDLCIVYVGTDRDGAMYALDADTGEQRWEYDGDGPGYGSPMIVSLAGKRQIVTPVSKFVAGLDIESGKLLWREPFPTHSTQNIITPLQHGDTVITGGIGHPTVALSPVPGEGATTVERVWENDAVTLHMSSPVLLGGKLYGLSRGKAGQLFCLDPATGRTLWQGEGRFTKNAAILVVDDLLAILTSDGNLIFARPTPTGLDHLAEYPVDPSGRAWAHPALVGKRILVKGDQDLICWSLP